MKRYNNNFKIVFAGGHKMSKLSFHSKETFTSIVNAIAVSFIVAHGGNNEQAVAAGSVFESILNGFHLDKSISDQMESVIHSALDMAFKNDTYEMPVECKQQLKQELFSEKKIQDYLNGTDQYGLLKEQIKLICSRFKECDTNTLPIEQIASDIVSELNHAILENHELTGRCTFQWIQKIHEDVAVSKKLLHELCIYFRNSCQYKPAEDVHMLSRISAEKIAKYYSDILFADRESSVPKKISDVYIETGFESVNGAAFNDFDELYNTISGGGKLLIEGDPGTGKSTQVMSLADRYLKGEIFKGQKVFFIRGKDIRHSNGNVIEDMKKCTGVTEMEPLDDAVIILDAYDEISYVSQSTDQNKAYLRQLEFEFDTATLIITSRPDYIKGFSGEKVKIMGFNPYQRKLFLDSYNKGKGEEERLTDEFMEELTLEDSQYDDNISELLSIPMLLYLIAVKKVDISEISDRYTLYENVFGTNNTKGAIQNGRKLTQAMWTELYKLASNIAHYMYMSNELYINQDTILKMIDNMKLDNDATTMLKNRFGIEIYLKGTDDQLFTFIHASIYEFFAAKWICNEIKKLFAKHLYDNYPVKDIIGDLNTIFNATLFNSAVFLYIMENIQDGYIDSVYQDDEAKLKKLLVLFNQLLNTSVCIKPIGTIPYILQMKNMLLWIFNTFNVFFGRFEIEEEPYWVIVNPDIVAFLIRSMEDNDFLFLSRLDLTDFYMGKADLGHTYFIDVKLTNANFSYSFLNDITVCGQHFDYMKMRSVDFYDTALNNCSFEYTDLRFSDYRDSILEKVSFKGADLRGVFLSDSFFFKCDFTGAHVFVSDFENATLEECSLENAILHDENEDPNEDIIS